MSKESTRTGVIALPAARCSIHYPWDPYPDGMHIAPDAAATATQGPAARSPSRKRARNRTTSWTTKQMHDLPAPSPRSACSSPTGKLRRAAARAQAARRLAMERSWPPEVYTIFPNPQPDWAASEDAWNASLVHLADRVATVRLALAGAGSTAAAPPAPVPSTWQARTAPPVPMTSEQHIAALLQDIAAVDSRLAKVHAVWSARSEPAAAPGYRGFQHVVREDPTFLASAAQWHRTQPAAGAGTAAPR